MPAGPRGRGKGEGDSGASRRREEDDYLDKAVTYKERVHAAKRIQHCWKPIARILDPKPFEDYQIASFEQNFKGDILEQAQKMLDYWANDCHLGATRRCLIRAMEKNGLTKAVAQVFPGNFIVSDAGDKTLLAILQNTKNLCNEAEIRGALRYKRQGVIFLQRFLVLPFFT